MLVCLCPLLLIADSLSFLLSLLSSLFFSLTSSSQLFDVSGLLILRCVNDASVPSLLETLLSPLLEALTGGHQLWQQRSSAANTTTINQDPRSRAMSPHPPPLATSTAIEGGSNDVNEDVCMYFARVVQAVGFTTKTFPPSVPPNVREMYRLLLEVRTDLWWWLLFVSFVCLLVFCEGTHFFFLLFSFFKIKQQTKSRRLPFE